MEAPIKNPWDREPSKPSDLLLIFLPIGIVFFFLVIEVLFVLSTL